MLATQKLTGEAPWRLFYNFTHGKFGAGDIAGSSNRRKVGELLALRVTRDVVDASGDLKQFHESPVCTIATDAQIAHYKDRMKGPAKKKLRPVLMISTVSPFEVGTIPWLPGNQALAFCEGVKRNGIRMPPVAEAVDPKTMLTQRQVDAQAEQDDAEKAAKKDLHKPRRRRRTTAMSSPEKAVVEPVAK